MFCEKAHQARGKEGIVAFFLRIEELPSFRCGLLHGAVYEIRKRINRRDRLLKGRYRCRVLLLHIDMIKSYRFTGLVSRESSAYVTLSCACAFYLQKMDRRSLRGIEVQPQTGCVAKQPIVQQG